MNTRRTTDAASFRRRQWGNDRPPADARHVAEESYDPDISSTDNAYWIGRFEGAWSTPIWRRIVLALVLVAIAGFALGYALGWTAPHG